MSEYRCSNQDCTVSQTGVCVLANSVPECPNILGLGAEEASPPETSSLGEPVLTAPSTGRRFAPSASLGTLDATAMIRRRGGNIIGVLGAPDSGKTASLVSLYLLLSHGRLEGFSFANSRSLLVLEDLARGARSWNEGHHPEQMTVHTELDAGRAAGFLHLRVRRESDQKAFDLFIPDLPGEWSTSLIDSNRSDRLAFLRGARAIWIMVDGESIVAPERKLNAIHRIKRLIDRVVAICGVEGPVLHLVITRRDKAEPDQASIDQVMNAAEKLGVSLAVNHIASFTDLDSPIAAGTGLSELIDSTLKFETRPMPLWPAGDAYGQRSSLRIVDEAAR
jgi:hypothetical protein